MLLLWEALGGRCWQNIHGVLELLRKAVASVMLWTWAYLSFAEFIVHVLQHTSASIGQPNAISHDPH